MQIRINVKGASRRKAAVVQQVREYPDGPMTVEEFLAETVRQNVRDYNERKEAGEILRLFSADVLEEKAQTLGLQLCTIHHDGDWACCLFKTHR